MFNIKENNLTEQDLHCMARILQSRIFVPNETLYYGCQYCKYSYDCLINKNNNFSKLRKRLEDATGVYLGYLKYSNLEDNFKNMSIQELDPEKWNEVKIFLNRNLKEY